MARRGWHHLRMRGDEGGSVTAEFALVLPFALVLLVLGGQVMGAASTQLMLQDAAADAARLLGRGESVELAFDAVRGAVPGAEVTSSAAGELVCATASTEVRIAGMLTVPVRASSCALRGGK